MLSRIVAPLVASLLFAVVPVAAPTALAAQAPPPRVDIWLPAGPVLRPGSSAVARFVADSGAYVTVVRLNSRGGVTVLYPASPGLQVRNGRAIRGATDAGTPVVFRADQATGAGFVFAVASYRPFDYRLYADRGRWNTRRFASARMDDPIAVAVSFVQRIAPRAPFSIQYADYTVGGGQPVATIYRNPGGGYSSNPDRDEYSDPEHHQQYPGSYYDPYGYYYPSPYGIYGPRYVRCPDGRLVLPGQSCSSVIVLRPPPVGTLPPAGSPRPASPRFRPPVPTPPVWMQPAAPQPGTQGVIRAQPMSPRPPESTGTVRPIAPGRPIEPIRPPGVIRAEPVQPAPATAAPRPAPPVTRRAEPPATPAPTVP